MKKGWILFLALFALAGCAGNGRVLVDEIVIDQPREGLSIPHPVEYEKAGVKKVTVFNSLMDPGLLTEAQINGEEIPSGNWKCVGYNPVTRHKVKCNFFIVDYTMWGAIMLEHHVLEPMEGLRDYKFINFSHDGQKAFIVTGMEAFEIKKEIKNGKEEIVFFDFKPGELKKNPEYEKKFYQTFGGNFQEIDNLWQLLIEEAGGDRNEAPKVTEYDINSLAWKKHAEGLSKVFKVNHKTPEGEVRMGNQSLSDFATEAVKDNRFNKGKSALLAAGVDIAKLAAGFIFPPAWLIAAGETASPMVKSLMDDSWQGYNSGAKVQRFDLAPTLRYQNLVYSKMLMARNQLIFRQQKTIECLSQGKGNSCLRLLNEQPSR
jgi:hypothetical protein